MAVPAPVDPTVGDRRVENLTTSLRRVERQKRSLEEWTGTLERTVSAHERVARDREAEQARLDAERVAEQARLEAERVAEQARLEAEREAEQARLDAERAGHAAELRVRAQEMAAVEMRLDRTLRSQSFRLGHLLVRIAVAPVKALKWVARSVRRLLVRVYRLAQRTLPEPVVEPLQKVATSGQVATVRRQAATVRRQAARRYEVLDLAGDRPVAFVDGRGLTAVARDELWARVAASDQPARTIVLTDDVDFTGLRALGLSFEYLPPYRHGTPWWVDEADHARWVDDRLAAMRLGYGVEDPDGSPAVVLAAGSADG